MAKPKFGYEEREQLAEQGLRRCTKCNKIKPTTEFYHRTDASVKNKLFSQCKRCTLARSTAYAKTPKGRLASRAALRKYGKTEKGKAARKRWDAKNLSKTQAGHAVTHAIERGELVRPNYCSLCNCQCTPEGHHWKGYEPEHWLDVQWLCRACHLKVHEQD